MKGKSALLAFSLFALVAARPPLRFQPDPSSVIAAELAFNRMAQDKGQWTAFRATAAKDAVMFVPEKVNAQLWLKGRADPPQAVQWSPSIVYVSCDGNLAASTGNWTRPDGSVGYFTTIWRREPKKGQWQWIMDHGDRLAGARPTPEYLTGKVATCQRRARGEGDSAAGRGPQRSPPTTPPADLSLTWTADVTADGGREVVVKMWTGEAYETVIDDKVAPEGKAGG